MVCTRIVEDTVGDVIVFMRLVIGGLRDELLPGAEFLEVLPRTRFRAEVGQLQSWPDNFTNKFNVGFGFGEGYFL